MEFLDTLTGSYSVFVVPDNQGNYSELIAAFPRIKIVQISDEECERAKYTNSDYMFKPIVATDRAFYYFNRIHTKYDSIWFCEDDVYIRDVEDLLDLDRQFPTAEMITSPTFFNDKGIDDGGWMHWSQIRGTLPAPWAGGLICCSRISRPLMQKVDDYVVQFGSLNYKEFLFHTLALHNGMTIVQPKELATINLEHRNAAVIQADIKDYHPMYHAVKNLDDHVLLRSQEKK
jgi:hypothetical protein